MKTQKEKDAVKVEVRMRCIQGFKEKTPGHVCFLDKEMYTEEEASSDGATRDHGNLVKFDEL